MNELIAEERLSAPEGSVAELLPALYDVEGYHWWTSGMRTVSHALLDGLELPDGPVLELGCGGGMFTAELARRFPGRLALGLDIHPLAVQALSAKRPARGLLHGLQGDLNHLPVVRASCSLVVALDVLDQAGIELLPVLAGIREILQPGGWLMLRVSAYSWLASPHDLAFGTGQRYSAEDLRETLAANAWRLHRVTYANTLLLPLVALHRLAQRRGWVSADSGLDVAPGLDRFLRSLLEAEACWLRRGSLPAGVSLYVVAQKPELAR